MKHKIWGFVYLGLAGICAIVAILTNDYVAITAGVVGLYCLVMAEIKDVRADIQEKVKEK